MTKTEFLEHLETKLKVLNQKERDDILSEYAQHIEFKMESGLSEEEAIHDFGNLEELSAEILDAYNVNPDYDKKTIHIDGRNIGKKMSRAGHKMGEGFRKCSQFVKNMCHDRSMGRLKGVWKCCLIVVALFAAYLPLAGIDLWIGDLLYSMFGYPFDYLLAGIVILGFHLLYLFFSVSVLYSFVVRSRYGSDEEHGERQEEGKTENRPFTQVSKRLKDLFTLPGFTKRPRIARKQGKNSLIRLICDVIKAGAYLLLKGITICILTPVLLFQLFLVVMFGILIVLVVLGYPLIGVTVISFGGLLCGFALIWFVVSILFSKKAGKEQ